MAEYFKGTVLASPIVRSSSGDTYGTHHSVLGVGGFMEKKTIAEMYQIPVDVIYPTIYFDGISSGQRRLGMLVHVLENDTIYQLHPKVGANYVSYATWMGYSDTQKYSALSSNTSWYPLLTTGSGSTLTGEFISKTYTQTTHSFIVGDVIGFDGSDFVKMDSTLATTVEPLGIVSISDWNGVSGANTSFTLTFAGNINTTGIVDYTGGTLQLGGVYYLATSGYVGKLSKYAPAIITDISKPMLVVTSNTTGIVLQYRGTSKNDVGVSIGQFNTYTGDTQSFLDTTVTGATNIGHFIAKTGVQTLSILTSNSLYNGNYTSLYNNFYRDNTGTIRIGSPTYSGTLRRGYVSTFTPKKSWLYNTYTGSTNQIGWILVDGDISVNVGNFLTANPISGTPVFTETEWWFSGGTMNDGYYNNSAISLDVNGNLYTGSTYNIGGPIFSDKQYSELRLRTIVSSSPNSLKVSYDDNFVYLSGSTSISTGTTTGGTGTLTGATNLGTGYPLYVSTVNKNLQFNSIIGSGSTTVQNVGNTLIINGIGGTGTINGAINGLSVAGSNVALGGTLTGNTTINNNGNTLNINNGFLSTTNGYQISGVTVFRTAEVGLSSVYIGQEAGSNGSGQNNIGIGYQTLVSNTMGMENIAIGCKAMNSSTCGMYNIAIGAGALCSTTIGEGNVGMGYQALAKNTTGEGNVGIGDNIFRDNTIGSYNLGLISGALLKNTIGSCNIAAGFNAGYSNDTGSRNIFIGTCAGYNEISSNKLYIANNAACNLIYGDFAMNELTIPTLKICNTPATGTMFDKLLVWSSGDTYVKAVNDYFVVTGATNGIDVLDYNIILGGELTSNTSLTGCKLTLGSINGLDVRTVGANNINLDAQSCGSVILKSQSGSTSTYSDFTNAVGISANVCGANNFLVYDNRLGTNQSGIEYASDYSLNYTNRSLTDKQYVDTVALGLQVNTAVIVATVGAITLSGTQTIDGVAVIAGDRVLVKDQANAALNGIYVVTGTTWSRATDYDFSPSGEIGNGDMIPVISGNTNGNKIWVLTTPDPIVSGDSLTFSQFSKPVGISAGQGIAISTIGGQENVCVKLGSGTSSGCGLSVNSSGLCVNSSIGGIGLSYSNGVINSNVLSGGTVSSIPIKYNVGNCLVLNCADMNVVSAASNGLTKVGNTIVLGGALTGNTTLSGNYTLNISGGAKINTTCGYQISGATMFSAGHSTLSSIYIGENAGPNSNNLGINNIGIGSSAFYYNTTGSYNVANGSNALGNNTIGCFNVANGSSALASNTIGSYNIAIGYGSLVSNLSGTYNIGNGVSALERNTTGSYNIANGNSALYYNTIGYNNIANGNSALKNNVSGGDNIAIGTCAGNSLITGSANIFIGKCAGYNETGSNKLYVANNSICNLIYGDFSTNIVTLPSLKLCTTPTTGSPSDLFLVWNNDDKQVKSIVGSAFGDRNNVYSKTVITGTTTLTTGSTFAILANHAAPLTVYLPLAPIDGQAFKFKDVSGNALGYNITIDGNGKNIDGSPTGIINTNYGAIEVMYNASAPIGWYSMGFVM